MTNLIIKQNNIPEVVNSAIIQKLYVEASDPNITNVELEGYLQSEHATITAYDYLTGTDALGNKRFPNLTLNITGGVYIDFEDPVVEQICATNWGDGTGLTLEQARAVTSIENQFKDNDNITSFNELRYFTSITDVPSFQGCDNLESVQIPPQLTNIAQYRFQGCPKLTTIGDISNIQSINQHSFEQCTNLAFDDYDFSSLSGNPSIYYCMFANTNKMFVIDGTFTTLSISRTSVQKLDIRGNFQSGSFGNNTKLTDIILPETTTSLDSKGFQYCTSISNITIKATTPPTFGSQLFFNANRRPNIYVPSGSVNAYKAAAGWSNYADKIQAIPES